MEVSKNRFALPPAEGFIDTVSGKGSFVAAQNPEFLREKRMKLVEDKLTQAVEEAKMLGIGSGELIRMLKRLSEEAD